MKNVLETFIRIFEKADLIFERFIEALVILVLSSMIFLTFLQVLLRDVFNSGISWADIASRHLVLWVAFLGAILVTRSRQHISIDILSRLISRRVRNILRFFIDIIACVVCVFLSLAAIKLVSDEYSMGTILFLGIPLWIFQLIIPIGFVMMALEYVVGVILDILRYLYNGMVSKLVAERRPI